MQMLKTRRRLRIFFNIPYLSKYSGYLGYQKSGINIAPFDQWSSVWEVTW